MLAMLFIIGREGNFPSIVGLKLEGVLSSFVTGSVRRLALLAGASDGLDVLTGSNLVSSPGGAVKFGWEVYVGVGGTALMPDPVGAWIGREC